MLGLKQSVCIAVLAAMAAPVCAQNSISVVSDTVTAGDSNVVIRIGIENVDTIAGLVMPLALRTITGNALPTTLALSFDERMEDGLADIQFGIRYSDTLWTHAHCEEGFGNPTDQPLGEFLPVTGSPEGVMFVALATTGDFVYPGQDSLGSLVLTMHIGGSSGEFIIDTTCTQVYNHLAWYRANSSRIDNIQFSSGVITVNPTCECLHQGDVAPIATNGDGVINVLDLVFLIDYVLRSSGIPPSQDEFCPASRGDVQCDGIVNILDITYVQNYIYGSGPQPCQPCDCDPYPGSCP